MSTQSLTEARVVVAPAGPREVPAVPRPADAVRVEGVSQLFQRDGKPVL
jgi:hypothetical protein